MESENIGTDEIIEIRQHNIMQSPKLEMTIQSIVLSALIIVFCVLYRALYLQFLNGESLIYNTSVVLFDNAIILLSSTLLLTICFFLIIRHKHSFFNFMFAHRYLFAFLALSVLTFLGVSGSSISMWGVTLPYGDLSNVIAGTPRWFRTDEFATSLAETFAQFNDTNGYMPYIGSVFRGTSTDMLVTGVPVLDASLLYRPLYWGYLLFGLEKGLAFYWNGRIIALFLMTVEVGLIFLDEQRGKSVALGILVSLGSAVCWWGSVEIIVYSEALFVTAVHFLKTNSLWISSIFSFAFFQCLGGLILTLYPAWIVPYSLLFLAMGLGFILNNTEVLNNLSLRKLLLTMPWLLLLVFIFINIYKTSSPAISLITGTVYPGARKSYGGGHPSLLFRSVAQLFTPFFNNGYSDQRVDVYSSFFDLFPLGYLVATYAIFIKKVKDRQLLALYFIELFYLVYFLFGLPAIVAKITLMSFTTPERLAVVIAFGDVLILFKSINYLEFGYKKGLCIAAIYTLIMMLISKYVEPDYFSLFKIIVSAVFIFGYIYFLIANNTVWIVISCLAIGMFGGIAANPLQIGINVVEDNSLIKDIKTIQDTDPGKWISQTGWAENIPTLAGAPTISSLHYYPNFDMWKVLDPTGKHSDAYNRFAHLRFTITDTNSSEIILSSNDVVSATVPIKDLKTLEVRYILSNDNLEGFNSNSYGVSFNLIKSYPGYYIYKIDY